MAKDGRPYSLVRRLAAWFAVCSFTLTVVNGLASYWIMTSAMEREDDQMLRNRVQSFARRIQASAEEFKALEAEVHRGSITGAFMETLIRIMDDSGQVRVETPGMTAELPAGLFSPPAKIESGPAGLELELSSGRVYRIMSVLIAGPSETRSDSLVLQIAMNRTSEDEFLNRQRLWLAAFLAVALAVCIFLGLRIARQSLAPMTDVIATARRIRSTTLGERLDSGGMPVELAELAHTFNEMLDRLEDSFRRISQFSSNIAHELRTPVNIVRGEVEVALAKPREKTEYQEILASVLEECGRLTKVIEALLFLARADNPATQIERKEVELAAELQTVLDFFEPVAVEKNVGLELQCVSPFPARIDPVLIQRAVSNLVSNSLDHTPSGGRISISARRSNGGIAIEVTDTGSGVAPEALPFIFDRFFRADTSRSSGLGHSGLGLAIVKSIALLHGGKVEIARPSGRRRQSKN